MQNLKALEYLEDVSKLHFNYFILILISPAF